MAKTSDFLELHDRQYSLYDSPKEQEEALKELHEHNYMIFDEDETEILKGDFYIEFDKVAHNMSFVSATQQEQALPMLVPKKENPHISSAFRFYLSHKKHALSKLMGILLALANGEPTIRVCK